MQRIDHPTAVSGLFTEGNAETGQAATTVTAEWANDVQEEICNLIEDADGGDLELDGNSQVQLKEAVQAMIDRSVDGLGGGGGGGETNTGIVKVTHASLNSDSTVTSTSNTTSGLIVTHTPVTAGNHKLVNCSLDWDVNDSAAGEAKGYAVLQGSSDNSSWSDLFTITKHSKIIAGKVLVKTSVATLATTHTTNSTSNVASGLAITYSPISGANTRRITCQLDHQASDSNGGGGNSTAVLQYNASGTWTDLASLPRKVVVGGISSPNVSVQGMNTIIYDHAVNDNSPQYRVVHRAASGDTSELAQDSSKIIVDEWASVPVTNNRSVESIEYRDTTSRSTAYYRVVHRVESGDNSVIYAGSFLRVKELKLS